MTETLEPRALEAALNAARKSLNLAPNVQNSVADLPATVAITVYLAATQAGEAVAKPLEWLVVNDDDAGKPICWQAGAMGPAHYFIALLDGLGGYKLQPPSGIWSLHPSEEAAKAAAQADYEQRIRSALASQPAVSEGEKDA